MRKARTRYGIHAMIVKIFKIVTGSNVGEDADSWTAPTVLEGMEDGTATLGNNWQLL